MHDTTTRPDDAPVVTVSALLLAMITLEALFLAGIIAVAVAYS